MVRSGITKEQSLENFLSTKKKIQLDLINLSYEEKIERVIAMQKLERDFKKDKSKQIYVWKL